MGEKSLKKIEKSTKIPERVYSNLHCRNTIKGVYGQLSEKFEKT